MHAAQAMCKLTFFAPYWLDNRTGLDLVFTDHQSAPQTPLLLGARVPWETTGVYCPGVHPDQHNVLVTMVFTQTPLLLKAHVP